ncbi:MAG: YeeE/YedE family protein [Melioribacteraceae bacterium]|nr:YeeE/YedE family protein [Melioribacteraceae bacterium]MCF8264387.1 YeeE/YedE family protein [Melioribacteraceae bacterium]MCF8413245.1 YeeE/YedE family protein [Melioribacteraceae bacterium]MCF8432078.1 YeeE/YedE family protein [Melioribacteraceae bacterium]
MKFKFLFTGILFGIIITKSEVISWFRIQDMFLFNEWHMYLVIGSAIFVGMIGYLIINKIGKTIDDENIQISKKPLNKGVVIGGILFGLGWAITGACPGPIFAQIGAGEYAAIVTLFGALVGAFIFNLVKDKLP